MTGGALRSNVVAMSPDFILIKDTVFITLSLASPEEESHCQ